MARRKLTSVTKDGRMATVYRDPETNEFVVRLKGRPQADYFTNDRGDAEGTAKKMVGFGRVPVGFTHRKLASKASCAVGSFRRVKSGRALVTVCCPKGKWKRGRCKVGMKAIGLDKPKSFGAIGSRTKDRGPMLLTDPKVRALEKIASAGIGKPTTRKKREFFLRHKLIRPVRGTTGYEVTAKGIMTINRTKSGSPYYAGR